MNGALTLKTRRGPTRKLAPQHASLLRKTTSTSRPSVGPGRYPQRQQDGWLQHERFGFVGARRHCKNRLASSTSWTMQPSLMSKLSQGKDRAKCKVMLATIESPPPQLCSHHLRG